MKVSTSKATITIVATTVGHQMEVIVVHVGKNMVDNVLLDGRSKVNVVTDGLRQKLGLPPP